MVSPSKLFSRSRRRQFHPTPTITTRILGLVSFVMWNSHFDSIENKITVIIIEIAHEHVFFFPQNLTTNLLLHGNS